MEKSRSWSDIFLDVALWWLLLMAFWWLLSDAAGWLVGAIFALCGAVVAAWLRLPSFRLRWTAVPAFIVFFLHELFAGAVDVARRALLPGGRVSPGWVVYPLRPGSANEHLLLSLVVGLLPGTFASHVDGDGLHLHVLDTTHPWRPVLERLEAHLIRLGGRDV